MRRSLVNTIDLEPEAFAAARSIMASVELQRVRLSKFSFTSYLERLDGECGEAELSSSNRYSWKQEGSHLLIYFDLSVKGHSNETLIFEVAAKLEATYEVPKEPLLSDFAVRSFAKSNGMLNVWPFWREYVQAATQRAGLAPLTLPLFRVIHKQKSALKDPK